MISRRFFGGMALGSAFAAAIRPAKAFAAEPTCRLRLGVLSDIHVRTLEEGVHFRKALKWFDQQKVDGVIISGDLGFCGLIRELKCVSDIWYEVFPGDRRSDGGHVEKLFVTGNHDVDGYFYHRPEFPKVRFPVDEESARESFVCNRERVWKELFHEEYETVKVKEVKGYKFVLFQWFAHLASDICSERWTQEPPDTPFYNAMRYEHKKLDEFFATRGDELKGERPFFFVQHHHPADTVFSPFLYASPQGWGGHDFGRSTRYLKNYPNCIAISGHTHVTMSDERAIWQGDFTSIDASACPGLPFAGVIGGRSNAFCEKRFPEDTHFDSETPKVGQLLSVYDDRIVVQKREFSYDEDLGDDWEFPWPISRGKPYAYAEQTKRSVVPEFPAGAVLKRTETVEKIVVEFPTVRCENAGARALDYEVTVSGRIEDFRRQIECRRVYSTGIGLAECRDRNPVVIAFDKKKMEDEGYKDIAVEVRPCDAWGHKGRALVARFLAVVFSFLSFFAFADPVRIIFDTDMCGDYDDVGALAVLNALADAGECEILGVVSSSRRSPALGIAELVNAEYGRAKLPMGACKGIGYAADAEPNEVGRVFRAMVEERREGLSYPSTETAPDANEVYRRLLADAPDGTVTLCTVGFLTNVRRLLETEGDAISPLSGRELVARKVKAWYAMGGAVPNGLECNLRLDPDSAAKAVEGSPVPVYFIDFNLGADVPTGLRVARRGTLSGFVAEAFVRCLKVWGEERRGRPSWDELTVLAAVRGWDRYFDAERGTMSVDAVSGSNTWHQASSGPHHVLVKKTPKSELCDIIDELMARRPACRREGANTRPFVWWHWCGTAVTKEGILRDLDAMADSGIGGATIFQVARGPCSEVPAFGYEDDTMTDFEFAGDKWWEYVGFAVREAKKRGLEIGMHNCPGYTVSGGPWITPENAMKKLVWTVARKGETPAQPETNLGFYREIGRVERDDRVYRFGYTCTGSQCMPVPMAMYGRCLEADKMSARAVNLHLDHVLARDVGLDFILMDSYEAGPYDWTDDFREEFAKRRGYDPLELLPAYVGEDPANAPKIKADMARTVGELSTERHYWVFRDRIHAKGMKFIVEPYGGPFDPCEAAYASDQPMTEFWGARPFWVPEGAIGGSPQMGGAAGRAAGRTVIAAEAFTAMPFQDSFVLSPRDFKACADASFARGINRMFLHHWVHQPFPACRKPGMNMGYWGAHFGENATWYEPGKEFIAYLARCQSLLQKGEEVVDVLAVEDFRGMTDGVDIVPRRVFESGVKFACGKVVMEASERAYEYLAVPQDLLADPAVAAQVAAALAAGVKVLSENDEMPSRPFRVVDGLAVGTDGPVLGTSRVLPEEGIRLFFVANVTSVPVSFAAEFRAEGQPELWYPGTCETEFLAPIAAVGGSARLPLKLGPQESVFVTFRKNAAWRESRRRELDGSLPVDGPWTVSFEDGCGAPPGERPLEKLASWTESPVFGIRYFSGTATYRTVVALSREEAGLVRRLDLGEVRDIARVRINGRDLGVAWYSPFTVDTRDALKDGENVIEVDVTNGWHNRLLGDKSLPDDCEWGPLRKHQCAMDGSQGVCGRGLRRIPDWAWSADGVRPSANRVAFSVWDYFAEGGELVPSGLIGPVRFLCARPRGGE